jgi:hypothetical protein
VTEIDFSFLEQNDAPPDILEDPLENVTDEQIRDDTQRVDRDFLKQKRRKAHAKEYENRLRGMFLIGTQLGLQSPNTVADAVAIIIHGPNMARAWGDLAAENETIANAIDFITKPSDSPITAAITATLPFALQCLRNHEPVLETPVRQLKIPFTQKEMKIRFNVKLGRVRNLTLDPDEMTHRVLNIPEIKAQIEKWGLNIASRNGRQKRNAATN